MFQYIYDQLSSINPIWYLLLGLILYNKFNTKKIEEVEGSLVQSVDTIELFNKIIKENDLVICDFYATWCSPCVRAAPIYANLSKEYPNCKFIKIDVDKNSATSRAQQIKAMPTFKFFKNGNELETIQGFSESNIKILLDKYYSFTNKAKN
jgi:thioredoxin 1